MLDVKFLRENTELVRRKMLERGQEIDFSPFVNSEKRRRDILQEVEALRGERNKASKEIGTLKKEKKDASELVAKMATISDRIKALDAELAQAEADIQSFIMVIPNVQHESVEYGTSSEDNVVVRTWGEKPVMDFEPKPHWDIGENLKILDFACGAKITGARFTLYRGWGAKLERALINYMLDLHTFQHTYLEVLTPFMVNKESMTGTGQLPKFAQDLFKIEGMDYYIIPTAEVPVTNIHRDEILSEKDLPVYYVAYSPCFRSEAGSYGKDPRPYPPAPVQQGGAGEVHDPRDLLRRAGEAHPGRRGHPETAGLHYRTVSLCTADLGFSSSKTYDLEVWLPGQNVYREISSCSNFEDFQARRASIRFRREGAGKVEFVHTLNGSGLAVGRTVVAILENYQQKDGSVVIPEPLRPYMKGIDRIPAGG